MTKSAQMQMKVETLEIEHHLLRHFLFDTVDVVSVLLPRMNEHQTYHTKRLQSLLDQAQYILMSTLTGLREEVEETKKNQQAKTPGVEFVQDGSVFPEMPVETDNSTRRHRLPEEPLRIIIKHTSPQDLVSCCLVNKSWSIVAREELWKNPDTYTSAHRSRDWTLFYNGYLSKLFEARTNRRGWDASRFVNRVSVDFDRLPVGFCQIEHLAELFPRLSELSLSEMPRFGDLAVLMRQRWRYLRSLKLINMPTPSGGRRFWTVGEEYDRTQAKLFFTQLQEISWGCFDSKNNLSKELLLDSAHPNLRTLLFPSAVPEPTLMCCLSRCSSALRSVCLQRTTLTDSAWSVFEETCTGLEALQISKCSFTSTRGLRRFIEARGSGLKYFNFGDCDYDDRSFLQHITRHCPALEVLYMEPSQEIRTNDQWHPEVDGIVDFIRGPVRPKLIRLDLFWRNPLGSFGMFKKVIEAVAECCPRMRFIRVPRTEAFGDDTETAELESELELPDELSDKLRKGCLKVKVLSDDGYYFPMDFDGLGVEFSNPDSQPLGLLLYTIGVVTRST